MHKAINSAIFQAKLEAATAATQRALSLDGFQGAYDALHCCRC